MKTLALIIIGMIAGTLIFISNVISLLMMLVGLASGLVVLIAVMLFIISVLAGLGGARLHLPLGFIISALAAIYAGIMVWSWLSGWLMVAWQIVEQVNWPLWFVVAKWALMVSGSSGLVWFFWAELAWIVGWICYVILVFLYPFRYWKRVRWAYHMLIVVTLTAFKAAPEEWPQAPLQWVQFEGWVAM